MNSSSDNTITNVDFVFNEQKMREAEVAMYQLE